MFHKEKAVLAKKSSVDIKTIFEAYDLLLEHNPYSHIKGNIIVRIFYAKNKFRLPGQTCLKTAIKVFVFAKIGSSLENIDKVQGQDQNVCRKKETIKKTTENKWCS